MMKSMFSGVSGLRAHQQRMDVIGNNVANVNTVGFKSSRVTFQEVFNQTLSGASAPDSSTSRGGTNPIQVGLGTSVGSVDTMMSTGSPERTDNATDLSISGAGFFIVRGSSADTYKFTRAGNFGLDKLGNLVSGSGYCVYGWQKKNEDGSFDTESPVEPINLYADSSNGNKRIIAANVTTRAAFSGNLNASNEALGAGATDTQFAVPFSVYDALGNSYELSVNFKKVSADDTGTTWEYTVTHDNGTDTPDTYALGEAGQVKFDTKGKIIEGSANTCKVDLDPATGAADFDINLNFNNLTMFAADSSVVPSDVNGYSTGTLTTFSIGSDGIITGIYSNGEQQSLGCIALASFSNPAGLEKVGDNLFIPTTNSGNFTKGLAAGTGGTGTLTPGTLEMSNVDLSSEFTNMIITQRGFQANSRIITTSDEMLQELVNLKR
ncbi:flagellar hook protein FlgE [Ruminiclostridium sufflavum DSM 19573]|uniref:Flagellar hook protein FlgE n=1 Tax=Ruminiclostridium sufflavum DSM 19573 TaxID=1121337 RepID=A0A318XQY6_9FIRM|nr:flagellar hook protein FlgE [Ruminiclostridium sufflavum]PYG89826.1 flagellar hook protein FlgE [Ruminiclostridium sufflavum DSM 19573]